ncbi:BCCT family transporter [Clostridium bowmanii]|uniref:BCCT family transporter n=1 Tax=Clostridium bowmanii TaxID=132925 RepID=UPI001C0B1792|nr:BCCT family transporter [Clostridium bowmanii]MBU3188197.1 BCCT family transporter [Clostridium bowmanii]MCA1072379.1 BCCT family transporter [Clostridium bowmanii]
MIKNKAKIRKSIFIPMGIIFVSAILTGIVAPEALYNGENAIVEFAFKNFGWLFQISGNIFLALCVYLMFSKYGNIKFGGKDAKPTYSYWNWFAITLTAGIATGILFWGIAEPITHFMNPPKVLGIAAKSEEAAMFAMTTVFIHWTFIPYAMYSIAGIGIAYAVYNMKLPYQVSSVLYPIFGDKIKGTVGAVVDNLCLFAMAGAVAAILGVGTMQIGSGLNILTGIKTGKTLWLIIIIVIVVTYIAFSYTGVSKGVRWLADKNSKIFLALMAFIFVFGPTAFILNLGTQGVGDFVQNFFVRTSFTSPINGSDWPRWWPIYYWAIWLAYAPLEGLFFTMLCKGRTIKQFLIVNLVLPSLFGLVWFSVFGGAAIHLQLSGANLWSTIQDKGLEVSLFAFLKNFPLSTLMSWIIIFTIIISISTLCDSMTATIASLSTATNNDTDFEAPGYLKIFWGTVMGAMAIVNILCSGGKISGIDATKQIATVAGFPILFLMLLMAYSTIVMIVKNEKLDSPNYHKTVHLDEKVTVNDEDAMMM